MALLSGFDQLDPANNTFSDWLNKTNEIVLMVRGDTTGAQTSIMTANSQLGGSQTFGNATLFGQFMANTMVVLNDGGNDGTDDSTFANVNFGGLRGGIWNNISNTITADTLYIVSNTTYTNESNEVYVNSTYGLIVENTTELRYDVLYIGDGPAGSNTNAQLHWQSSNNQLNFNDDVRATFGGASGTEVFGGTGQYEMFYSAADNRMYSNTDIQDIRSTANLNLITDRYELRTETGGENMMTANLNGEVVLYWDNAARVTTNSYGVTVHGDAILEDDLVIFDGNKILMGGNTTYDGTQDLTTYKFQMFTDGSDAFIKADDRDLYVEVNQGFELTNIGRGTHYMTANAAGQNEVSLYAAGTKRLETIDGASDSNSVDGVEIYGEANTNTLRVQSDANFDNTTLNSNSVHWDASLEIWNYRDNVKATWGDGDDLQVWHDGADSWITENGSGSLYIQANNFVLEDTNGTDYISMTAGAGVTITHAGAVKITTTAIGVNIEGEANTDTLRVQSTSDLEDDIRIQGSNNTDTLTWDKSANTLNFDDMNYITLGTSADFTMHHDGSNTYLTEVGSGELHIQANNVHIENTDGDEYFLGIAGAGAALHFAGTQKLITTNIGVEIEGQANTDTLRVQSTTLLEANVHFDGTIADQLNWISTTNKLLFKDNVTASFGDASDLQIYHNGTDSHIENITGNFYIRGNNLQLTSTTGNEEYLTAVLNGAVSLFYDDAVKLATTATGVNVTGTIVGTGLDINGSADLGASGSDTISMMGVVDTDIVPSGTVDLGTSAAPWTELWVTNADIQTLQVDLNATITGEVTANNFVGDGAQLTDLDGSEITTGTVAAARIDNELTSNTSGIAAKAEDLEINSTVLDQEFRVTFTANSGAHRDVFADSGLLYNPADKMMYADNLTVNTQINMPNTVQIETGNFEDLVVANTATILNLEVATLEANGVAFAGTGNNVNTSSPTVIDTFPVGQTQGFKYFIHGEDLADSDSGYAVEINVIVTDNKDIFYTRYGEVESNMNDVTILPAVAANNTHIDLLATCGSASGTNIHQFKVLKIETRP
jgi:hypothetical protein